MIWPSWLPYWTVRTRSWPCWLTPPPPPTRTPPLALWWAALPEWLPESVIDAEKGGDLAQLTADITKTPPLLQRTDPEGRTLLYIASWHGRLHVVELLLDRGADKDKASNDGWTPLMAAAAYGKVKVVEVLLRRNARLDLRNKDGMTALDVARDRGRAVIVDLLVNVRAWGPLLSPS